MSVGMENDHGKLINSKDDLRNITYCRIVFWKIHQINVCVFMDLYEHIKNSGAW